MYKLSLEEQETIIRWDRKENDAIVYTCDPSIKRKLKKMAEAYPEKCYLIKEDQHSVEIKCPIKQISIREPRKRKALTEEQRSALSERAKKNLVRNR